MEFESKAKEIIESITHPAINNTLVNLGIIRSYGINEKNVNITMAFPALNIPIADMLKISLKNPLTAIGANVEIDTEVMTKEELDKFLNLENEGWKGL